MKSSDSRANSKYESLYTGAVRIATAKSGLCRNLRILGKKYGKSKQNLTMLAILTHFNCPRFKNV